LLRQSISLDLNGVALGDALREISAKAGMQLAFSNTMLPAERTVTFRADHITVAAALTELLIDTQVDVLFSRDGRAVLVRRAAEFPGRSGEWKGDGLENHQGDPERLGGPRGDSLARHNGGRRSVPTG